MKSAGAMRAPRSTRVPGASAVLIETAQSQQKPTPIPQTMPHPGDRFGSRSNIGLGGGLGTQVRVMHKAVVFEFALETEPANELVVTLCVERILQHEFSELLRDEVRVRSPPVLLAALFIR